MKRKDLERFADRYTEIKRLLEDTAERFMIAVDPSWRGYSFSLIFEFDEFWCNKADSYAVGLNVSWSTESFDIPFKALEDFDGTVAAEKERLAEIERQKLAKAEAKQKEKDDEERALFLWLKEKYEK